MSRAVRAQSYHVTPGRPLIGGRTAGAATATFSLVRVTISMILRSLCVVPGSATASVQAAAPVLVVLHKVWFVCQDRLGQAAGWRTVRVTCLASSEPAMSSLQSPHTTLPPSSHTNRQSRRLLSPQPHPRPGQVQCCVVLFCTLLCLGHRLLAPVQIFPKV